MSQEELLNNIKILGNEITEIQYIIPNNPIYTVDKNKIIEWFEKIKNFTQNETSEDLKEKLEIFINGNQSLLDTQSDVIDTNIFQNIRQEFRECFTITDYLCDN